MHDNFATWFLDLEQLIIPRNQDSDQKILRLCPAKEQLDLRIERPFGKWKNRELLEFVEFALNRQCPALELATLAFFEAKNRKRNGVFSKICAEFKKTDLQPIIWLDSARKSISGLTANYERPPSGMASVYFILLGGYTDQSKSYGCYVGQTATTKLDEYGDRVSKRIAQHFMGVKSGRGVHDRGIEPLWSLNCFTNTLKAKGIKDKETECSLALRELGVKTKVDIQSL